MRYRSITSILPMLKMQSGNPDLDRWRPELAQMVPMLERNLGLSDEALHKREAINVEVKQSVAQLPVDFFEPRGDIIDFALSHTVRDMTCCTCNCIPCTCGFWFWYNGCGDFSFGDTILRCPFRDGSVSFEYWGLEMDEEGLPMILDSHVPAFNAFAISILKQGEMNAGQIPIQLWQVNQRQWENESLVTRSRDNVMTRKQIHIAQYKMRNKFRFL